MSAPLVLATQSLDGPTLWVSRGRDWQRIAAPPGRLAAASVVGDGVYLLIEGSVWFRELASLKDH